MIIDNTKSIVSIFLVFCLFLAAGLFKCTDPSSSDNEPDPNDPITVAGYYAISRPYKGKVIEFTAASYDTIQWTSNQGANEYVAIYLCQDTTVWKTISSMTLNSGTLLWSPYLFGTATNCRIKIASYVDPTKYDFSAVFSTQSEYSGVISIVSPSKDTIWTTGTSYTIQWTSTGNIGAYVKIELYNDTTFVSSIITQTSNDGMHPWACNAAASDSTYRIKISSYYDPGIHAFSEPFTITKGYTGTITVTSPTDTTVWYAGGSYNITWTTTGNIGTYVRLGLYQDTVLALLIVNSATNNGTYAWNIPAQIASGVNYQVKATSVSDEAIYDLSDSFSISGIITDSYETDNTRDSASLYDTLGSVQSRSLTFNDVDWVAFQGTAGMSYVVQTTGNAVTNVYLYYGNDANYLAAASGNISTRKTTLVFNCDTTGTYYLYIVPYNATYGYGTYSLKATGIDPYSIVTFTAPTSTTTWSAGSAYNVQWQADTALFGQTVRLSLCTDTALALSISSSTVNDGLQSWTIPQYLSTGSSYRIRLESPSYPALHGYSEKFTVSGLNPDVYEFDNTRDSASSFDTLGTIQYRSLTLNDTDWVSFSATAGKSYSIQTVGGAIADIYLYYEASPSYLQYSQCNTSTRRATMVFDCDTTGTYYTKISYRSISYCGEYMLRIGENDPFTNVTFTAPTSTTTWSSGTAYSIQWQADTVLFDRTVRLVLCEDTAQVLSIYTSAPNNGTYSWTIPTALATSGNYRIRMASATNALIYGYSSNFTISGIAPDTFEVDDFINLAKPILVDGTIQNHTLTMSDTDWVAFPGRSGMSYLVNTSAAFNHRVYLYFNNTSTLVDNQNLTVNKLTGTSPDSGTFYVKVSPYNVAYGGSYTISAREYDPNNAVTFTNPTGASTWSTGSAYTIQWTPDTALLSNSVRIYLMADTTVLLTISSTTPNDGDHPWTVTNGLESGSMYRIKIANSSNVNLFGYSQNFSISGILPDTFEVDDTASLAHQVVIGEIEPHTMPYGDIDWFTLTAEAKRLYIIETLDSLDTRLELYSSNLTTLLASDDTSGTNNNARIAWICPSNAGYYFRVLSSYTGTYRCQVNSYDSTAYQYTISSPVASSSYPVSATVPVTWSATIPLGGTVDIFLYNTAGVVATIEANTADDGSHSWTIPSTVAPAADYRIKIANRSTSEAYGFSGVFTVTSR